MHAKAYSDGKMLTIIPPYGAGGLKFPRHSRLPIMDDIRECVYLILKDRAKTDHRLWWYSHPYRVTVREESKGVYVYSVHKGTGPLGKPAVKDQR